MCRLGENNSVRLHFTSETHAPTVQFTKATVAYRFMSALCFKPNTHMLPYPACTVQGQETLNECNPGCFYLDKEPCHTECELKKQ